MGIKGGEQQFLPYSSGMPTSEAAAESMVSVAERQRVAVFASIEKLGENGRICDEIEVLLDLAHQSCSARIWDLAGKNRKSNRPAKIADSGRERLTRNGRRAVVWVTLEFAPVVKEEPGGGDADQAKAKEDGTSEDTLSNTPVRGWCD